MAKLKKDDVVIVLSGKDKGRTGKILKVFPSEGACIVEKVNIAKRHQKSKTGAAPSGIIEKNQKISMSKLSLVDQDGKPSRVHFKVVDGKKVRVFATNGKAVD